MSDSFVTPWTVAGQAPPSKGFSRKEYWCGLSFPPPGVEPTSALQEGSLRSELPGKPLTWISTLKIFPSSVH